MKRIFHHPSEPAGGKKYWRSLDELAATPGFETALEREFPQGAAEFNGGEVSRRHFMKIMGASTALAGVGLAGCRRPEMHLVPFTRSAEWSIPGKFLFYTTSMPSARGYVPLIVSTYEGRPTKIEGNPYHPINDGHGGTDLYAQASVLNMYDPDRARFFLEKGNESDEASFVKAFDQLIAGYAGKQGDGLAILMEEDPSPTRERLRAAVEAKLPKASWCIYEPLGTAQSGAAEYVGFGPGVKLRPLLDKADVVLALDCDFLGSAEGTLEGIKGFTKARRIDEPGRKINRLYAVENRYTVTGGMADHRLRIPVCQVGVFALQLAAQIAAATGDATLAGIGQAMGKTTATAKFPAGWVKELAKDLVANRGRALVLAGAQQAPAVHLIVAAINSALGALGNTLTGIADPVKPAATIAQLASDIAAKKVSTLIILGCNPVYDAPADLEWSKLQQSVPNVIRLGHFQDETSQFSTWNVPRAHFLEYWGDGRSADGTYVAVQPMILPLFGGWSDNDLLAKLAGMPKPAGPELVQETFRQIATGPAAAPGAAAGFDAAWNKFLHDGFLEGSASGTERTLFFMSAAAESYIADQANLTALGEGSYEIVFTPDFHTYDGRYNNNGWLQEVPDPITKLTWDNAALMSPATAKALGVENHEAAGDVIEISLDNGSNHEGRSIMIPILIAPGHADGSISISLGYGRWATGRVGTGTGYNAYPLRTSAAPYFAITRSVKATGERGTQAITQQHFSMEGRAFVREGTLATFAENPTFAKVMGLDEELPKAGNPSLYTHPPLTAQEQWGMAIDLNTCTGCNACVIACQAENNSPIVGKQQVINGREMHWMRLDRYFASTDETDPDPEMLFEPLLCQQCENAPCETVCPVNATVHTPDGLNSMAYNRCIGTRYCANNCPYKVRRFNFFDYNQRPITPQKIEFGPIKATVNGLYLGPVTDKSSPDTIKMQKNPNVTVRMRGVMEKCTFCVQRIEEARIATKVKAGASDKVKIPVDAFQSACQQACPNEAIVFGDITEPASKVSKLRASPRGYRLLEYLNTSPRILYLAKLRNPNPRMPGAEKLAAFEREEKKGGASPLTTGAGDASGGPK
jgi:molybdopterin-containing oxidoreductase family iron-sulfur binding subunit